MSVMSSLILIAASQRWVTSLVVRQLFGGFLILDRNYFLHKIDKIWAPTALGKLRALVPGAVFMAVLWRLNDEIGLQLHHSGYYRNLLLKTQ